MILESLPDNNASLFLTAVTGLVIVTVTIVWIISDRKSKRTHAKVPSGTVLLYGVGRGLHAPSASPFPLKLETYCRMARIPYMVDHSGTMSSKGKTPWMEYNGVAVADSQLCIQHLNTRLGVDLNIKLSPSIQAQARAFRELTEENLYWTMCHELFIKNPHRLGEVMPYKGLKLWLVKFFLGRVLKREMWGHGIGRHTDSEIWDIGCKDLVAISNFLGDKKFFCGEEPTEVDCSIFAMLCQVLYHMPGSRHESYVREKLPNIIAYVERMKGKYWPDWKERCKGANYVEDSYTLYPPQNY